MTEVQHLAEAAMLSSWSYYAKRKFLYLDAVHPESRDVVETYAKGQQS